MPTFTTELAGRTSRELPLTLAEASHSGIALMAFSLQIAPPERFALRDGSKWPKPASALPSSIPNTTATA